MGDARSRARGEDCPLVPRTDLTIRPPLKRLALVLALCAAALTLPACGSDKPSQQEAEQNLCTSLDEFAASVTALQGLSLTGSSGDDVKAAVENIDDQWNQVVDDAKSVKSASTDKITSTWDDLKQSVQDRSTDESISEMIAALEPKVTAFAAAWKELADGLGCEASS